jgi:uncharacterized membrane protein YccC
MSNWIKWWKNKTVMNIIYILLTTVISSAISAIFIPWPWNLITVLIICAIGGLSSRSIALKALFGENEK